MSRPGSGCDGRASPADISGEERVEEAARLGMWRWKQWSHRYRHRYIRVERSRVGLPERGSSRPHMRRFDLTEASLYAARVRMICATICGGDGWSKRLAEEGGSDGRDER